MCQLSKSFTFPRERLLIFKIRNNNVDSMKFHSKHISTLQTDKRQREAYKTHMNIMIMVMK